MSGPKELLNLNNGYLFSSNDKYSLLDKFIDFKNSSYENNKKKKIVTKKKFKIYSIYNHYLQIKELLK